jgi:hypothetical protein
MVEWCPIFLERIEEIFLIRAAVSFLTSGN